MAELLKVEEVAERLQVPPAWVYAHAAMGDLPSLKLGRYVRFESAAVEQYITDQRRQNRRCARG